MNRQLLIALLLSIVSPVFSQIPGLSAEISPGITLSSVKAQNELPGIMKLRTGYAGLIGLRCSFGPGLFIETQVGPTGNGYYLDDKSYLNTVDYQSETSYFRDQWFVSHRNIINNWVVGKVFGHRTFVELAGGMYYSIYLITKATVTSTVYIDPLEYDIIGDPALPVGLDVSSETSLERSDDISPVDFGIAGQAAVGYRLNEKLGLKLIIAGFAGLKDRGPVLVYFGPSSPEQYNRSVMVKAGIEMTL